MSTAGQRDDVVVVGGGPAGAVTALVLARQGARVRVFERARVPRPKLCGDTLNPGALAALGPLVDVAVLRTLGCALHGMRLSGPGGAALEGRYPAGVTGLGITRATLDAWLLAQAVQAGAVVDDGVNVLGPVTSEGAVTGVRLATAAGARVHEARIVVAADGRHSRLASALGLLRTPVHPRRWALGAYAHEVGGVHAGSARCTCAAATISASRRWTTASRTSVSCCRGRRRVTPSATRGRPSSAPPRPIHRSARACGRRALRPHRSCSGRWRSTRRPQGPRGCCSPVTPLASSIR